MTASPAAAGRPRDDTESQFLLPQRIRFFQRNSKLVADRTWSGRASDGRRSARDGISAPRRR
ncbi:hypothetical protein ACFFRC_37015, partial [Amycolatopsis halotolerans]|uniref:hypothetical protein n=1 Tax=Amycolatopsis halotolerans TaxID=330083 RepID=UPI0035E8D339